MSLYDLFVFFHSDDIDTATGAVDDNVVYFDEKDILTKKKNISSLASQILEGGDTTQCTPLLQMFHRTIEQGAILQWEGATVGQVCLAEG